MSDRKLTIRASKRVEFAIPVTVSDEIAKRIEDGDMDAWDVILKAIEDAYKPQDQWLDEDDFTQNDIDLMD